jgi:hypothetical protein
MPLKTSSKWRSRLHSLVRANLFLDWKVFAFDRRAFSLLSRFHLFCWTFLLPAMCYVLCAMCYVLCAMCYVLCAMCYVLCAMCYLLPATCYLLPATCYLLPATCYLLPATCHLPPATCHLPPATCHLPPATGVWNNRNRALLGGQVKSDFFSFLLHTSNEVEGTQCPFHTNLALLPLANSPEWWSGHREHLPQKVHLLTWKVVIGCSSSNVQEQYATARRI